MKIQNKVKYDPMKNILLSKCSFVLKRDLWDTKIRYKRDAAVKELFSVRNQMLINYEED